MCATAEESAERTSAGSSDLPFSEFFRKGAREVGISAGVGFGFPIFGTLHHHHWGLGMAELGWMLTDVAGEGHWYRGNWEMLVDVFAGTQFHPDTAYLFGLGPELRYNLVTGTRWVPFLTIAGGISATGIRNGDLSTTFEFNLQAGPGVHYFLKDNIAVTVQYRLIHLSNAGLEFPNLGVNNGTFLAGVSWFW